MVIGDCHGATKVFFFWERIVFCIGNYLKSIIGNILSHKSPLKSEKKVVIFFGK